MSSKRGFEQTKRGICLCNEKENPNLLHGHLFVEFWWKWISQTKAWKPELASRQSSTSPLLASLHHPEAGCSWWRVQTPAKENTITKCLPIHSRSPFRNHPSYRHFVYRHQTSLSLSLSLSRLSLKNLVASRIVKGMSHFKRGKRKYPLHLHPSCQRRLERWRRRASTERVISKIHDVPISCSSSMRDSSSSLDLLETV